MDAEKFGSFIQTRRKELGLKQTDVAQKLYVTPKAVSRWERGVAFLISACWNPLPRHYRSHWLN